MSMYNFSLLLTGVLLFCNNSIKMMLQKTPAVIIYKDIAMGKTALDGKSIPDIQICINHFQHTDSFKDKC